MPRKSIEQVLRERTDQWMAMPGVVGTAVGRSQDRPCILILTSLDPAELRAKIPCVVDDYPVVIRRTDEIHALDP